MTNLIAMMHTTAAYQSAVVQLMIGEANFAANQLALNDRVPPTTNGLVDWTVSPPPLGVAGSIVTTNFNYSFERGRLNFISKREWIQKTSASNLLDLARQPSRLNTNSALNFATQALARLDVNLDAVGNLQMYAMQVPARKLDETGANLPGLSNNVSTPLFQFSWGQRRPPLDSFNPVRIKILATTPEVLQIILRDSTLSRRPVLNVTNAAELLGPLPPPRHFVEELYGGRAAYEAVAHADRLDASLLNSHFTREEAKKPEVRQGPVVLSRKLSQALAKALLDFETYHWNVAKLCSPDYGVKLRFTRGGDTVDVRLCFECDILEITFNGKTRTENFDFNHNELAAIAKKIFPKDAVVQALAKQDEKKARQEMEEQLSRALSR